VAFEDAVEQARILIALAKRWRLPGGDHHLNSRKELPAGLLDLIRTHGDQF